jgi:hypothetical protein
MNPFTVKAVVFPPPVNFRLSPPFAAYGHAFSNSQ